MYNLDYRKPDPLVPRRLRREVVERIGPGGEVRRVLDEASVRAAARRLRDDGVEAVAVALLHAYANPAHERRVAEVLREEMPAGTFISCSHDVLPEIREYERTSTTVVNALLGPVVSQYLAALGARLEGLGIAGPLQIMQSNGGLTSVRRAAGTPARILESGPAAGVIAAARVARLAGSDHLITLDMGGTTAKTAIIENGEPAKTTEYEVGAGINLSSRLLRGAGYAVKLPFIDVSEIGAGGGSKVWFDQGGLMQVGPQSAGSVPGPVCYGTGGDRVTLTDALVALGYLNPDHLLGGDLALDAQRAASAHRRAGMHEARALPHRGRPRHLHHRRLEHDARGQGGLHVPGPGSAGVHPVCVRRQWARHRHGDRARARDAAGPGTAEPRGVQRAGVARFGA